MRPTRLQRNQAETRRGQRVVLPADLQMALESSFGRISAPKTRIWTLQSATDLQGTSERRLGWTRIQNRRISKVTAPAHLGQISQVEGLTKPPSLTPPHQTKMLGLYRGVATHICRRSASESVVEFEVCTAGHWVKVWDGGCTPPRL